VGRAGDGGDPGEPGLAAPKSAYLAQFDLQRDLEIAEGIGITLEQFYSLPEGERAEWVTRWEVKRDTCKFHGGPKSECGDDDRDWFPQLSICQPSMQLEAAKARYEQIHSERPFHDGTLTPDGHFARWSKTRSADYPYHWSDGVGIFLAPVDLGLGGDFLEMGSVAEQAPGEQEKAADQPHGGQ
jgi:hypothetical protein